MKSFKDDCCLFTVVSGEYQWYVPLFLDRAIKAYPEYDVVVIVRENLELEVEKMIEPLVKQAGVIVLAGVNQDDDWKKYPKDGLTTAALRLLKGDELIWNYDYALITDIDVMIMKEKLPIVEQHLRSMEENGTVAYDNILINGDHCSGVHFVTDEWWTATLEARENRMVELQQGGQLSKKFDEYMLYGIIRESGLGLPKENTDWATHGLHLGRWRNGDMTKTLTNEESLWVVELLRDNEFMGMVGKVSGHLPFLNVLYNKWREEYGSNLLKHD